MGFHSLETLGVALNTYRVFLLTVLRKSIANELCLEYYRRKTSTKAVLEDDPQQFLNFLKAELESRQRAQRVVQPVTDAAMKQKAPSTIDLLQTHHVSVLAVPGGGVLCTLCDQEGHTVESRITAIAIDKKTVVMSEERRCYKCAKRNPCAIERRTSRWLKCAKFSGWHKTGVYDLKQRAGPLLQKLVSQSSHGYRWNKPEEKQ
ncbi:hypothetical protein MRX96_001539 [Rhipicephalus microplus]|uniref:Uncharacterized protein n=1 Tax=Rhipicephalus microplus TaxID=6941 RepID=A0A9J6F9M7_RHIMP|nr:hypothetical protein HPB51_024472 [Rhipicephalus microplus]